MTFTRRKFFTFSGSVAALSLFSQAEAMPVEPPTKYDGDFDIVIVGGGGAGLSAACAASELGASVLVLEKRPFLGGSSLITDAMFAVEERNYKNPEILKILRNSMRKICMKSVNISIKKDFRKLFPKQR